MNLTLGDTQLIKAACEKAGLSIKQTAYVLATAYHETAHKMKPVREAGGEAYLKSKKYYPFVGMGYVQLTWEKNYKDWSDRLGVDFIKNPKLLLKPEYAVRILVDGMRLGTFTGRKLSDYISGSKADYKNARRIINGTDKADLIAQYAKAYETELSANAYSKPVAIADPKLLTTKRFWTWASTGGGAAMLPLVDWRAQLLIIAVIVAFAVYAIATMPQVRKALGLEQ